MEVEEELARGRDELDKTNINSDEFTTHDWIHVGRG